MKLQKIHPHLTLLYLGIVGSTLLFFFVGLAFVVSLGKQVGEAMLPRAFVLSTQVIVASIFFSKQLIGNFRRDQAERLYQNLLVLLVLGLVFFCCQVFGWLELQGLGVTLRGSNTGAFLYILSGLHLAHLVGGLVFTIVQLNQVRQLLKDPVKALVVFSSKYDLVKMQMLAAYWHFLDAVWLVLFLAFLFAL